MRLIDADAFCGFLREVSTRHHYETLLTKKDKYPTVADVIEEICCDLDGTGLNGFDNAPTIDTTFKEVVAYECGQKSVEERPKGKWLSHYDYCAKHGVMPSALIAFWWCDQCEQAVEHPTNFCPDCGARMESDV